MDETMQKIMVSAFGNMSILDLGPSRGLKIHLRAKLYEKWLRICNHTRGPVKCAQSHLVDGNNGLNLLHYVY